jgi:hypothetical protein
LALFDLKPKKVRQLWLARLAQAGAFIGVFGHFSSKCAKNLVKVPSGLASDVVFKGYARRNAERLCLPGA